MNQPPAIGPQADETYAVNAALVGLDLGSSPEGDYSCISVTLCQWAEKVARASTGGWWSEKALPFSEWRYSIVALERWPLGTQFSTICADTAALVARVRSETRWQGSMNDEHRSRVLLGADATGLGRPIVEQLKNNGLNPVAITITAGDGVTIGKDGFYRVGKPMLVDSLLLPLEQNRLKVAAELPALPDFVKEMLSFQRRSTQAGNETFSARQGSHDDIVLSCCVALYCARLLAQAQRAQASRKALREAWSS